MLKSLRHDHALIFFFRFVFPLNTRRIFSGGDGLLRGLVSHPRESTSVAGSSML